MSDTAYPIYQHYGTNAERLAFTPDPPASGQPIYIWYETDNPDDFYIYTTAWKGPYSTGGGAGTVTNTGTLTSGKAIIGNGSADVTVSSLTAQFVGSSSGTQAAASMTTARLLGRTTASSGAVEEITVGSGLSLAAGALTATGGGGGLVLLEQHTAAAAANLDFTTFYSSTYDDYEIRITGMLMGTSSANLLMTVSADGGSNWNSSANYYSMFSGIRNDGTGISFASNGATAGMIASSMQNDTKWGLRANLQLVGMGSTTLAVGARGTIDYIHSTNYIWSGSLLASFDNSTTAYNALRFAPSSGTFTGTIRIYGLEK